MITIKKKGEECQKKIMIKDRRKMTKKIKYKYKRIIEEKENNKKETET